MSPIETQLKENVFIPSSTTVMKRSISKSRGKHVSEFELVKFNLKVGLTGRKATY